MTSKDKKILAMYAVALCSWMGVSMTLVYLTRPSAQSPIDIGFLLPAGLMSVAAFCGAATYLLSTRAVTSATGRAPRALLIPATGIAGTYSLATSALMITTI